MGFIYKATNTLNGKVYIGQTIYSIEHRWKDHIYASYNKNDRAFDNHLHRAIRKYGSPVFVVEAVEQCNDEDLDSREEYWIAYFDSVRSGYNMTCGGEGVKRYSDESIFECWNTGLNLTEIQKKTGMWHVSQRLKQLGVNDKDISDRRYKSMGEKNRRCIYRYDLDGNYVQEYSSISAANRALGVSHIRPGKICCESQWRDFKADKIPAYCNRRTGAPRKVNCYSTDGVLCATYKSAADAARTLGLDHSNIGAACYGRQATCGGFIWKFADISQ